MHLIVPFAGVMSEAGRAAVRELSLPHLARALDGMGGQWLAAPAGADPQEPELSLTPPHEHVKALALGLTVTDGQVPWAALEASRLGLPGAERPWGASMRSASKRQTTRFWTRAATSGVRGESRASNLG
jgi:hypothetical protein